MGWSGGSYVFNSIWEAVRPHIAEDKRVEVCEQIIDTLTDQDWDTLDEALDEEWPEVAVAMKMGKCPKCNKYMELEELNQNYCGFCGDL